jgi:hypothetical protein
VIRSSIVIAVGVSSTPALAQTAAESLIEHGHDLIAAGKLAEACDAFDHAWRSDHAATTQLDLADCRERNGQLATAWRLFADVERKTRTATDAAAQQLHDTALARASGLAKRASTLTLHVAADSRVHDVEIDGRQVVAAWWNRALPVDGGTHAVTAHAPGGAAWSIDVAVAIEGEARTVDVPEPAATPAPTDDRPPRSLALPLSLGVDAVVLGGVALAVELDAEATYGRAKVETGSPQLLSADQNAANSLRHLAQGLAVGGAISLAAAVWLYARDNTRHPVVVATPTGVAVAARF